MSLSIQSFHHSDTGTWSYLVVDLIKKECALIDPVMDFDLSSGNASFESANDLIEQVLLQNLNLKWILETHAHADHITAADYIKQKIGGKTVIGSGITKVQEHFVQLFNMQTPTDGSQFDRLVIEGDKLTLGGFEIEIFETPGHTSDSIVYKIDSNVFIGDTFFHPNSGTARCDFPGGDANELFTSLQKIMDFESNTDKEVTLWLCHDYPGSDREAIDCFSLEQMKANIHLITSENKQSQYVQLRQSRDAQLSVPKLLYPALQVNICAGKFPFSEDNGANYLKLPVSISN